MTSQLISLYNVTPEQIGNVRLKDITLEVIGRSQHGLSLGSLKGNRFEIVVRDIKGADIAGQVAAVTGTTASGLPNYYGIQRFGVIRPLTHRVGELILKGDFESAVLTYIGRAYPEEPDETESCKECIPRDAGPGRCPAQSSRFTVVRAFDAPSPCQQPGRFPRGVAGSPA